MHTHEKGLLRKENGRRQQSLKIFGVCLLVAGSTVAVAETRQHGIHEHGSAVLNVAIADQTMSVEYITPAANIVGFEHTPTTEEQKHAVHEAVELLETGKVLNIPADAACTLAHAKVEHEAESDDHEEHAKEEHGEHEEDEEHAKEEHDEHEEHEEHAKEGHDEHEEHEEDEGTHSEFHVEYEYQCENMGALTHIDVDLFKHFPGNEKITTQAITPNGQKGMELTANSSRLTLP
ncbi:MAG: DUF2796 domain-containing protein [Arenicellales bacterium]|nr:DUF2796 domain-containing protein [Arenicellales bacterium]